MFLVIRIIFNNLGSFLLHKNNITLRIQFDNFNDALQFTLNVYQYTKYKKSHIHINFALLFYKPTRMNNTSYIYSHNKMEHFQASFTDQISQQFTDQHYFEAAKTTIFHKEQIIYVNRYTDITFYKMKKPLTECFQISAELTWSNSAELIPASNLFTVYQPYDWEKKSHTEILWGKWSHFITGLFNPLIFQPF